MSFDPVDDAGRMVERVWSNLRTTNDDTEANGVAVNAKNRSSLRQHFHRRSIRLHGYDYGQAGAYFVTIVTHERACLFGQIVDGQMQLNAAGMVAHDCWLAIPDHFPFVELDAHIIMPNHVHGIIVIADDSNENATTIAGAGNTSDNGVGAKDFSPLPPGVPHLPTSAPPSQSFRSPSKTVGSIVRGFKIGVTKWVRTNTDVYAVWQRNYYDHIIRNETSLNRIREYILTNPSRWSIDSENRHAPGKRP